MPTLARSIEAWLDGQTVAPAEGSS
jgi:hypothetical protein